MELSFMNKKLLAVFHRVDYDGLFSYAVISKKFGADYDIVPCGFNYGDDISTIPSFEDFDKIVLADISLPKEQMVLLNEKFHDKTLWIDHHITAINLSKECGYDTLLGVRDISMSACKLCWKEFFDTEVPYAVDLVATNDIWDKTAYDWENEVQAFQCGLGLKYKLDYQKVANELDDIIENTAPIICNGCSVNEYMGGLFANWCERFSFPILVNGQWNGIAMISPIFSSKIFKTISKDYDCCVVLEKSGQQEGVYNVSMYATDKEVPNMSCGEYMKNFNGGGHKGAGGGTLTFEQFANVLTNKTL